MSLFSYAGIVGHIYLIWNLIVGFVVLAIYNQIWNEQQNYRVFLIWVIYFFSAVLYLEKGFQTWYFQLCFIFLNTLFSLFQCSVFVIFFLDVFLYCIPLCKNSHNSCNYIPHHWLQGCQLYRFIYTVTKDRGQDLGVSCIYDFIQYNYMLGLSCAKLYTT